MTFNETSIINGYKDNLPKLNVYSKKSNTKQKIETNARKHLVFQITTFTLLKNEYLKRETQNKTVVKKGL